MESRRIARLQASVIGVFLLALPPLAAAGPYSDALGKCLVSSTTAAEKTGLVRWMFAMMALHPDVQASSAVTPEQRQALSKETAQLFQRLLTETCATQAREAIRYEGQSTIETSFSLLGNVAARSLFENPKVAKGLSEFSKFIDEKTIKRLAESPTQ